jgi:hypothetical protein
VRSPAANCADGEINVQSRSLVRWSKSRNVQPARDSALYGSGTSPASISLTPLPLSRRQGLLAEEERDNGAAIKKAIEGVISDMAFELQSETAERGRARV